MKKFDPFFIRSKAFLFTLATLTAFSVVLATQNTNFSRAASVTVNCSGTSGAPTAVDEASLAADDVTFSDTGGDGYCELDNSISAASVIIENGVVLTHVDEDADGVTITTTGDFNINSGGSINVDERGCPGIANGAGRSPNASNACGNNGGGGNGAGGNNIGSGGGSHGGPGGRVNIILQEILMILAPLLNSLDPLGVELLEVGLVEMEEV